MKGHIRKRGKTWSIFYDLGPDEYGRRRQRSRGGFQSRADAERELREALSLRDKRLEADPGRQTIGELFASWIGGYARRRQLRPSTEDGYRRIFARYIQPRIGAVMVRDLRARQVQRLYDELLEQGKAVSTVRHVHVILRRMLRDAVRLGVAHHNITDQVDAPRAPDRGEVELTVWSARDLAGFLGSVRSDRLYALWRLLATTGARRGEAVGVWWEDLDLEAGVWQVRRALVVVNGAPEWGKPKTKHGRRLVPLDATTVEALRAHKAAQAREKLALGGAYRDEGLVFSHEDGSALHPNVVTRWFYRRVEAAKLPRIRLHDLRHSAITAAIEAGVNVKVVSERVGHARSSFTMDVYRHVLPEEATAAADVIARAIDGAR